MMDATITELTDSEIVVNFALRGTAGIVDVFDRDWNLKAAGGSEFYPNNGEGIRRPLLEHASWTGKYSYASRQVGGTPSPIPVEVETNVTEREVVELPAGKFEVIHVEVISTWKGTAPSIVEYEKKSTLWYSPELDLPVKVNTVNRQNGHIQSSITSELFDGPR